MKTLEQRFFEKVDKKEGCWEWTAARKAKSKWHYGAFGIGGRMHPAHRVSWKIHFGDIPPGMYVCHKCDNPPCVNPEHLFLGNDADNQRDCIKKGRDNGIAGQNRKKTHCVHGHEFTPENILKSLCGARRCKTCHTKLIRAKAARMKNVRTN